MSKKEIINCREFCRMTKTMQNSEFCEGTAEVIENDVIFSCIKNIKEKDEATKNFHRCIFWDLSMSDKCNTCPLKCKENKNKLFEKREKEIDKLNKVLENVTMNFGVSAETAYKIVEAHKKADSDGKQTDAIEAVNFANEVLSRAMSGQSIDISHFKFISQHMQKKLKKK